jgi:O-antigen/teichoic acid export membrane protein
VTDPSAMQAAHAARALRANVAANYVSLAFAMAAGVVAMPIYLRLLGVEAFGLVGFFTLLSAAFQVFDAGLSQTFARECARVSGGARDPQSLRRLLTTFEITFFVIAAAGAGVIVAGAPALATGWLRVQKIPVSQVVAAIMLMGVAVPCQWVSGLYRGVLIGFERQVWLAGFNVAIASARSFGVIGALIVFGREPVVFFAYQAGLAVVELMALVVFSRRVVRVPAAPTPGPLPWGEFRGVLRFSSAVAFTAVSWLLLTSGDKVILSRVLSLANYGVFTLAAAAAGAVAGLGAPIAQAILPRLTRLNTAGDEAEAIKLYSRATQLTSLVALPAAMVLALFAGQVIWIWTGNPQIARQAAPILAAYAVGSGLATLAAFPYYLQYSHGALRLHVIGQFLMLAPLGPALYIAATRWGAVGTGVVWTLLNAAYILLWTPVVHARFAPGLHGRWLTRDIAPIAGASAACAIVLAAVLKWPPGRVEAAVELVSVSASVLLAGLIASSAGRAALKAALAVWR